MARIPSAYTQRGKPLDAQEKERLILEYAPVIKYIAQRLAIRLPPHISVDDLINAGVIGLIDAIEKYDPSRDNTFKTYAEFRIRGAMLDELRNMDWVPRSVRQKESALNRAYEELERRLGRSAEDEEVAAFLGIDTEELYAWLNQLRGVALLSLDALGLHSHDGEPFNLLDILPGDEAQNPVQMLQKQRLREILARAIDELPYQERVVISLYYFEELTMKEIGKVLHITESRVSQIHTKAIFHLRSKLKLLRDA
ncbi:MAG: RNA polymerase sigma factor WhiG [Candidatus Tectimicrobiota bacterium]|nr:MAG: RNA polymerase sigma factor WhiG [Candidatus Tectomicrobia bacterium]